MLCSGNFRAASSRLGRAARWHCGRELQEELGVNADIGAELYRTQHYYPGFYSVILVFHHVIRFSGRPRNRAFAQIRWATTEELPTFNFLAGDAELIDLLNQGRLSVPPTGI